MRESLCLNVAEFFLLQFKAVFDQFQRSVKNGITRVFLCLQIENCQKSLVLQPTYRAFKSIVSM